MEELKKTPLYDIHKSLGARMVPFAGWSMPVQYSGVIDEHRAVREAAGLFDVSHMGEIDIEGPHALDLVQMLTTNDASKLHIGQAQYSILCYPNGGIVDDALVYRFGDEHYLLCVNASNTDKDYQWIKEHAGSRFRTNVRDVSSHFAQLAIQGRRTVEILNRITDKDLESIQHFSFDTAELSGADVIVSRTGYTGEDGFEIYLSPEKAAHVWESIMESGKDYGIKPIGLGARDTLRLEMKYALYGNDIDENTTPLEANLKWIVKFHKSDFIGRDSLIKQHEEGIGKKLVCLEMQERGIPRHGYEIFLEERKIGVVTSGTMSPSLGKGIAIGYVETGFEKEGQKVHINIRGKASKARIVTPPFYRRK